MSNPELLACPFCGDLNAGTMVDTRSPIPYLERCSTCGAQGPKADSGDEAIAAWNRRTQLDELRAERRMLLDLLAIIHRDGGQYVDTHGLEKAWQDAISLSAELRAENARLVGAFLETKAALSLTTLVEDLDGVRECIAEIKSRIDRHISKALGGTNAHSV